jgi:hypothetical protein
LEGYILEELDPLRLDEDDEMHPVQSIDHLIEGLGQHPGLGAIYMLSPPEKCRNRESIYINLRDVYGTPMYINYLTMRISLNSYKCLDEKTKKAIWDFHLKDIGDLPNVMWLTLGRVRDYFPEILAGEDMFTDWQEGKQLIPLDYTWVREDFYQRIKSVLPGSKRAIASEVLRGSGGKFLRLYDIEPNE